MGDIVGEK